MQSLLKSPYVRFAGLFCPILAISLLFKFNHQNIAYLFLVIAILFFLLSLRDRRALFACGLAGLFSVLLSFGLLAGALYYPVIVSFVVFVAFASSLFQPECIIQRIAKRLEPDIPEHALSYCYKVNIVWTVFLGLNTTIALYSIRDIELWSWYNGVFSYVLMALLFVIEYSFRVLYRKRMEKA